IPSNSFLPGAVSIVDVCGAAGPGAAIDATINRIPSIMSPSESDRRPTRVRLESDSSRTEVGLKSDIVHSVTTVKDAYYAAGPTAVNVGVTPWYRTITRDQWRVLVAAKLGWMLDAMDFMIYAMAVVRLKTYFGFDDATAGMLGTVTLAMSAIG